MQTSIIGITLSPLGSTLISFQSYCCVALSSVLFLLSLFSSMVPSHFLVILNILDSMGAHIKGKGTVDDSLS